jgi:hypothetical protein
MNGDASMLLSEDLNNRQILTIDMKRNNPLLCN